MIAVRQMRGWKSTLGVTAKLAKCRTLGLATDGYTIFKDFIKATLHL